MKIWRFLMGFQHGLCYLCGRPISKNPTRGWRGRGDNATKDHVRPKSAGHDGTDNILMACYSCNTRKSGRQPYACEIFYCAEAHAAYKDAEHQHWLRHHAPKRRRVAA